jgi:hypothetical protein
MNKELWIVVCLFVGSSTPAIGFQNIAVQADESRFATVYVNVVGALAPLPIGSRIALIDGSGKVVQDVDTGYATGGSSRLPPPKRFGMLSAVPFGTYDLRVEAYAFKTMTVRLVVDRPERWVTVALSLAPSDRTLERVVFRIKTMPGSIENPIWARLVGVYSQVIEEARVDESGRAEFVVTPSSYVLILLRGRNICRVIQLNTVLSNDRPLVIGLPKECQAP